MRPPSSGQPSAACSGHVARMCDQGPDDGDVERDDQERPDRVVGDEQEVGHHAERGARDPDDATPQLTPENAETGAGDEHTQQEVEPTPRGEVERVDVVGRRDVEVVVHDGGETGERLPHTDDYHHRTGEDAETARPRRLVLIPVRRRTRRAICTHGASSGRVRQRTIVTAAAVAGLARLGGTVPRPERTTVSSAPATGAAGPAPAARGTVTPADVVASSSVVVDALMRASAQRARGSMSTSSARLRGERPGSRQDGDGGGEMHSPPPPPR